MPRARSLALFLALTVVAWLASGLAMLCWLRQRPDPPRVESVPEELVGRAEAVRLSTADGESLGAWFLDAGRDDAPSVVELHGRGGTRRSRLGAARIVGERGCATLLVTLRAHGDSTGEACDFGWSARHDVTAAVEWCERRRPGRPVLVHGSSMGAAAALFAADELDGRVAGYALECLYRDLDTAARNRCELFLPAVLERFAYGALRAAAAIAWPDWTRVSPLEALAGVPPRVPILFLAGEADRHVSLDEQHELLARAGARARLVVISGAEHDRLQGAGSEEYAPALLDWIDRSILAWTGR